MLVSFLPSFSNSFAAFTDKEANELNGIDKKKQMESDTTTNNLKN